MKIVFMSDTHGLHDGISVPDGDILAFAGDVTNVGKLNEVIQFRNWIAVQPHKYKLVIAGNHDFLFEELPGLAKEIMREAYSSGVRYLQDEAIVIDSVKFYGSPWQPWFGGWAFNLPRDKKEIKDKWRAIPEDTDVLITHGPPHGFGDMLPDGREVGCKPLAKHVKRVKPKIHAFGHIHCGYGTYQTKDTLYINCSICSELYQTVQKPIVIEI